MTDTRRWPWSGEVLSGLQLDEALADDCGAVQMQSSNAVVHDALDGIRSRYREVAAPKAGHRYPQTRVDHMVVDK